MATSFAEMQNENPVNNKGLDSPKAAGGIVIGALVALILIRRGFRGGVSGAINVNVR